MEVDFLFDRANASKQQVINLGHVNDLERVIENFLDKHGLETNRLGRYVSDAQAMLYEISHDPDCEYSNVVMFVPEN